MGRLLYLVLDTKQVVEYDLHMAKLVDAIRKAIAESDQTRYRIAMECGVSQAQLSRLMSGETGLSVESVETLAEHLGLEITIKPKRRSKKGK